MTSDPTALHHFYSKSSHPTTTFFCSIMKNTPNSQKSSNKGALLPARTVLDNLNVLAPREEEAINRFLNSSPQIEHCQRQRVRLLESQTKLGISFVCWQLAFERACPGYHEKDPTEWHEFDEEIQSHHSSVDQIMRCIISVSKAWGDDVVQHYAWQSVGLHNCNKLRSLCRKFPSWPVLVRIEQASLATRKP
ncbi:hypothetical protein F5883DRAFT_593668 [Diaporthe sp. PMI_573]|jgi:hypothetical protein|nr:hypothetical protein F5883DRAFT_593668 [Diaporthaceae sp. PMI_573]